MDRIDLLRWAVTGGTPDSCTGSDRFDPDFCDTELWDQPGNQDSGKVGTVCNDTLDVDGDGIADGGCILRTNDGERIKVRWDRVNSGLIMKFKELDLRPRLGAMFYSNDTVRNDKVYIGDYAGSNMASAQFPYMNLITYINSTIPDGMTPTGPAMWDALNYYEQQNPEYEGFTPQSGPTDIWKNPMYICDETGANCQFVPCASNFVLLMSDGQWNRGGAPPAESACSIDTGFEMHSADPVVPAYKMHMGFTNVITGFDSKITATYTIGLFLSGTGEQSMKNVAMYGSFNNSVKTWPSNLEGYPDDTCDVKDCGDGKGSACEPLPLSSDDWDKNGDGIPDGFFGASNALDIKNAILDVILDILRRTASGTAASVLASGDGTGANLVQAIFYPALAFDGTEITWTGTMKNLWFHIDPFLGNSTIREDTIEDKTLLINTDRITHFFFDNSDRSTKAKLFDDADGDGIADNPIPVSMVALEDLNTLWEAGIILWERDPETRTIYTTADGRTKIMFTTPVSDVSPLIYLLQAENKDVADRIISYTRGTDYSSRFCSISAGVNCITEDDCPAGESCIQFRNRTVTINGQTHTWKLGDIVNSTPRIVSWIPLNNYHKAYGDNTYKEFTKSAYYTNRGMVFVGGNDGMLHAFNLGKLELFEERYKKAILSGAAAELGKEEWAYIPKNVLPYLRFMADTNYCHTYTIDLTPYIFDASIGIPAGCGGNYWECTKKVTNWRTIIIGGMRQGGACKDACTNDINNDGNIDEKDCVVTPADSLGFSSYFALDITDLSNPQVLWEFSNESISDAELATGGLGFSTSGPAVIRIAAKQEDGITPDHDKNGKWFVVFGSGPTGPIDEQSHMFKGFSDQPLKIFILDLATGQLLRTINARTELGDNFRYAFSGSMLNAPIDFDQTDRSSEGFYQDDAMYFGFVRSEDNSPDYDDPADPTQWNVGGVIRLFTKNNLDPNNWTLSIVMDTGPVTAAVAKLQNYNKTKDSFGVWLFFGEGRYFYKIADHIDDAQPVDDSNNPIKRKLYGIREPCYLDSGIDFDCTDLAIAPIVVEDASAGTATIRNWAIELDESDGIYKAERNVTDPLASPIGAVIFTTTKPTADICGFGGASHLWAIDYDTGGEVKSSVLRGSALMQVSTGSIEEIDLKTAFTERGGRRTSVVQGVPPTGTPPSILVSPEPTNKFIHIFEK
jgi:type IV pilus assembly protein PilY1